MDFSKEIRKAVDPITDEIREAVTSAIEDFQGVMEDLDQDLGGETAAEDVMDRSFPVELPCRLSISDISGEIEVRGGEGNVIHVHAQKEGSRGRRENTYIEFRQDGNEVTVRTRSRQPGSFGLSRNVCRVNYRVIVPRSCDVQAHTVNGEVTIAGTGAPASVEAVNGDVHIDDIRGNCSITTVNGDVSARHIAGSLVVRTTNGDIKARESRLERFNLNSVNGDFTVETPLELGQHYFAKTVSGDLRLMVPPDTAATVQLKTVSGDVRSDLPAEIIKSGRRHWQGRINGGGATVEMQSVSGDLRVAMSTAWSPTPPGPPSPPAPATSPTWTSAAPPPTAPSTPSTREPAHAHDAASGVAGVELQQSEAGDSSSHPSETEGDTASVLRSLERGEITVEEAMARLDEASS